MSIMFVQARTTQQKVEELSHVVGVMGTKVDEQMEQIGGVGILAPHWYIENYYHK